MASKISGSGGGGGCKSCQKGDDKQAGQSQGQGQNQDLQKVLQMLQKLGITGDSGFSN